MNRQIAHEIALRDRLRPTVVFVFLGLAACLAVPAAAAADVRLLDVQPTVFHVRDGNSLRQVVDVTVENDGEPLEADLRVKFGNEETLVKLGKLDKGKSTVQAHVPEIDRETPAEFTLIAEGKPLDNRKTTWQPGRRWEVYFVPVTHHDLGYTDTLENVLRKYDGFYDDILRFCEETADWPVESRYRYSVEGTWSVQHFLRNRPQEVREKLGKYIREGRVEIPALFGNEVGALCSHEELIRLMYPSFRLKREFSAPIRTASITDVPGLSWGLPTVLSGAGVKYFFAGLPTYFSWSGQNVHDFWDEAAVLPHGRPGAFRWEGIDGGSVLVYYQGGYGNFTGGIGPRSYEEVLEHLPGKLEAMENQGSPLSVVRYIHNGVDNFPPDVVISRIVRQWNERWAYPKLLVSTNAMFFEQLDKQCDDVPTFRGELPDTDYVVGAASTPLETSINRTAHDRLHAAEKFATMANLLADYPRRTDANFWITAHGNYPDLNETLGEAYDNAILYDEHTWGMAHQVGKLQDWNWSDKSHYAYKAAGLAQSILDGSLQALAEKVALKDDGPHLIVFNALSTPRTDVVRVPSKGSAWGKFQDFSGGSFELIDQTTGEKVPCQVVKLDSPHAPVPYAAQRYARGQFHEVELYELVFIAEDVPPMGWKTYRMVPVEQASPAGNSATAGEDTAENGFFKVTLDPRTGAVASIYDKALSRELVDQEAPHGLNQFVARWVQSGNLESPKEVTIRKGESGPVYESLLVSTAGAGCPQITQEVILYDKIKRIDLANRILKDSTPGLEVYFAFPFKIDNPEFRFEGTHSVMKPLRDQFPGSNSNYYTMQHWAHASDGKVGVTLSPIESHLMEFGGLWPCYVSQAHHGVDPPDFGKPFVTAEEMTKGHMVAFVLDANFQTNFPPLEQTDLLFRYAITAHEGNWTDAKARDFGWGVGNPLVAVSVDGKQEGPLPPTAGFCRLDPPNVFLLTLKQAEDAKGIILRLMETEGKAATATLTLPHLEIAHAFRTNLAEENESALETESHQLAVPIRPFETVTVRVQGR